MSRFWSLQSFTHFDPGSVPYFEKIDHEIISMVILLPSTKSFKKGCCQLLQKYVQELLVNCLFKLDSLSLPRKKVWLGELTVPP